MAIDKLMEYDRVMMDLLGRVERGELITEVEWEVVEKAGVAAVEEVRANGEKDES